MVADCQKKKKKSGEKKKKDINTQIYKTKNIRPYYYLTRQIRNRALRETKPSATVDGVQRVCGTETGPLHKGRQLVAQLRIKAVCGNADLLSVSF